MIRTFCKELLVSCRALALCMLLAGIVYPAVVTLAGQALFPRQASGSLIATVSTGQGSEGAGPDHIGSELVGQPFAAAGYFHGRPSATSRFPYDAAASSGSNHGPLNPNFLAAVSRRAERFRADNSQALVPVDMATASASGLDPHVSPAAALAQAGRVATARSLPPESVRRLVMELTEPRLFGVFGEPRVNVLKLNLALDAAAQAR